MTDHPREAMIAVARAHATAEAECDIEAAMATLGDDPVYELRPIGRPLRGRDFARSYYEHFFANCVSRVTDYSLRSEWITDEGVLQEYTLHIGNSDGTSTRHDSGSSASWSSVRTASSRVSASTRATISSSSCSARFSRPRPSSIAWSPSAKCSFAISTRCATPLFELQRD